MFVGCRYGWSALHYACTEGNKEVVEFLKQAGIDLLLRDKDGTTGAFRAQVQQTSAPEIDTKRAPEQSPESDGKYPYLPKTNHLLNVRRRRFTFASLSGKTC